MKACHDRKIKFLTTLETGQNKKNIFKFLDYNSLTLISHILKINFNNNFLYLLGAKNFF